MRKAQNATALDNTADKFTEMNTPVAETSATATNTESQAVPFAFTDSDIKEADKHAKKVISELNKAEKAFTSVACEIRWLYESDRYKALETASTFEQFIEHRFGFKKSQGYNLVKLVDRFGECDENGNYTIKKDFGKFGQSKLVAMIALSDEQIAQNFNPSMSLLDIKKGVKNLIKADALGVSDATADATTGEQVAGSDSETIDVDVTSEKNVQALLTYTDFKTFENDLQNVLERVDKVFKAKPDAHIVISYEW